MKRFTKTVGLSFAATLAAAPALAHHPMGGTVPETFWHGLLSGFGHPVIGVDHLAFVVAVGLAAAFTPRRFATPLAFIAATIAGCLLTYGGIALPFVEFVVTGSVVLVGALVLSGRRIPGLAYAAIFAVAGLFHGWAYGAAIIGAETTPLLAYLGGFAVIQYGIACAAMWVARTVWNARTAEAMQPRLAGAVAAGIGAAFLIENLEGLIFA